jgi:hypothetical protein
MPRVYTRRPPIERVRAMCQPDPSGCLLWTGCSIRDGYGRFRVGEIKVLAHRFAWEMVYGAIPDGMFVLHTCDVPACVRIEHLWLGDNAANMADKVAKGRQAIGETHGKAKFSDATIALVRELHAAGTKRSEIVAMTGCSPSYVGYLVHNKRRA